MTVTFSIKKKKKSKPLTLTKLRLSKTHTWGQREPTEPAGPKSPWLLGIPCVLPARGSGQGSPGLRLVLSRLRVGGADVSACGPEAQLQSVPALAGGSELPTRPSHLLGDVSPLGLLGGRGRPSGAGQPAGLENSLGPSLWPPCLG